MKMIKIYHVNINGFWYEKYENFNKYSHILYKNEAISADFTFIFVFIATAIAKK